MCRRSGKPPVENWGGNAGKHRIRLVILRCCIKTRSIQVSNFITRLVNLASPTHAPELFLVRWGKTKGAFVKQYGPGVTIAGEPYAESISQNKHIYTQVDSRKYVIHRDLYTYIQILNLSGTKPNKLTAFQPVQNSFYLYIYFFLMEKFVLTLSVTCWCASELVTNTFRESSVKFY